MHVCVCVSVRLCHHVCVCVCACVSSCLCVCLCACCPDGGDPHPVRGAVPEAVSGPGEDPGPRAALPGDPQTTDHLPTETRTQL
jgi:hypothetical protein